MARGPWPLFVLPAALLLGAAVYQLWPNATPPPSMTDAVTTDSASIDAATAWAPVAARAGLPTPAPAGDGVAFAWMSPGGDGHGLCGQRCPP